MRMMLKKNPLALKLLVARSTTKMTKTMKRTGMMKLNRIVSNNESNYTIEYLTIFGGTLYKIFQLIISSINIYNSIK